MKTIYTFLLIMVVCLGSYAQKPTTQPLVAIAENSSFSINKVYPNPASDYVTLELQSKMTETIQIRLFNILGTELKKWEHQNLQAGNQKLKFDLSFLKSGVYILKISGSKQVASLVIRKN